MKFCIVLIPFILCSCVTQNEAISPSVGSIQHEADESLQRGIAEVQQGEAKKRVKKIDSEAQTPELLSPNWKMDNINTVSGAEYLSESDKKVIIEINMLRTDPPEYARRFLKPIRNYYKNMLLQYPGDIPIRTKEGRNALDECIRELLISKPQPPLSPKKGLALAAKDLARDQSKSGDRGHAGSDGSTLDKRLSRYGKWRITTGENIAYGNGEPRKIVASLLIDDGVP